MTIIRRALIGALIVIAVMYAGAWLHDAAQFSRAIWRGEILVFHDPDEAAKKLATGLYDRLTLQLVPTLHAQQWFQFSCVTGNTTSMTRLGPIITDSAVTDALVSTGSNLEFRLDCAVGCTSTTGTPVSPPSLAVTYLTLHDRRAIQNFGFIGVGGTPTVCVQFAKP